MKRKSGRKSTKKEDESANGVEDKIEQNGDTSDYDEEESPRDKKRKSSKSSRKNVSFTSKRDNADLGSNASSDDLEDDESEQEKKKPPKKGRKSAQKEDKKDASSEGDQDEDDESQYEVEAVLDDKMIKGVRHYLIRWKGYEEESDTWEPENTLDCERLILEYKENKKKNKGLKQPKKEKKEIKMPDWDENEDFEVERIIEVHFRKDGKREFLVSWKGYSSSENSWEPEENMDCKDLIAKFMAKVERARQVEEKELRVKRTHVQRYTLSTNETGRRLSKRMSGKERVQYHDAE